MESWYFFSIISLYLFLKCLGSDFKSLGSLRSARTKQFNMRRFCYLCRHRSGKYIENASDTELKSVFGRNLYDTVATNSIFEMRLTSYCPFLYTTFQPTARHEWIEGEYRNSYTLSLTSALNGGAVHYSQ